MSNELFAAGRQSSGQKLDEGTISKIKEFGEKDSLQKYFEETISDTIKDLQSILAEALVLEYHVVVFNNNENKRYTIMETKRRQSGGKQDDSKQLNYGVIGWLNNNYFSTEFIMAQAGFSLIPSHIFKLTTDNHIEEVLGDERIALIGTEPDDQDFRWAENELPSGNDGVRRTYAIAAMRFRDGIHEEYIGALSLDFVRYSKEYPNFAFRKSEINLIYQKMERIIQFIERTLEYDYHGNMCSIIQIARGESKNGN